MSDDDTPLKRSIERYQVISAYLALEPPRGQRRQLLEQLANRTWTTEDGQSFQVAAETIRGWVRRYRRLGLPGLEDKPRPARGVQVLSPEARALAVKLKQDVPERSLDRIITIAEETGLLPQGLLRRSTLHRVLKHAGVSARACRVPDRHDLDRFEADLPNELWQSDMLCGPWLPDPARPSRKRRAYLYAFLDDHSRLLLHGRFSFKGDLPALELVFRRCLQKYGVPTRVYYDNGAVYRSRHMKQIVACLGIHGIAFTQVRRPEGHGKIEALNRLIRSAFLAELKSSNISTLDELNEAFCAWSDLHYNRKPHGETGEPPVERFRTALEQLHYADDEALRQAFLWREDRTSDKAGVFSLFGLRYQVSAALARKRVQLRYDPEELNPLEVWHNGRFVERARPFEVRRHRRPKTIEPPAPLVGPPAVDWLGHLVEARRSTFLKPATRQLADTARLRRSQADQAICDLLEQHLEPAVFDETIARAYLERFGPFDPEQARDTLVELVRDGRSDHHITLYLDAIRDVQTGEPR